MVHYPLCMDFSYLLFTQNGNLKCVRKCQQDFCNQMYIISTIVEGKHSKDL